MTKVFAVVQILLLAVCGAVDISVWEEGACIQPPPKAVAHRTGSNGPGLLWVYTPLCSKYELYKMASLISGIALDDLTEKDVQRSCLRWDMEDGSWTHHGFNGKKVNIVTSPGEGDGVDWKPQGETQNTGKFWITLETVNYTVSVSCWASGQRSFSVATKTKTLETKWKNEIVKHVTSLGFDPKYFYDYSYENCKDDIVEKHIHDGHNEALPLFVSYKILYVFSLMFLYLKC